eukprot:COSAG06_NODE_5902_length_3221_cov_14.117233_5_plen_160_part_00
MRKNGPFLSIYIYKRTFYQDRLGTNIGKALKKGTPRFVSTQLFAVLDPSLSWQMIVFLIKRVSRRQEKGVFRTYRPSSRATEQRAPAPYTHITTIVNVNAEVLTVIIAHVTANCIIVAPKRLKLRLSGSARKSQKRFRDTPRFKFQAVLARTQPFYHAA